MSAAAPPAHAPLYEGVAGDAAITDRLLEPVWRPHPALRWGLWLTGLGAALFVAAIGYTLLAGIGVWGNNIPAAWAFAITNFVWWIGIGHAGTFISAFLYLLNQQWRTSINRIAEAMTLFAVTMAGIYPLLHLGRAWFFYWLIPYPSTMGVWPQFRSSLTWDVAAITTYGTISLLFWYLGLVPDLAAARDRAPTLRRRRAYGLFALGWRGSATQWRHHRVAYLLLAGLATPLVISVHSVVSLDFAIAQFPGWDSTIFPPYFVSGAIFSGFAMVLMLVLPLRAVYRLHDVITVHHLDKMAKITLLTALPLAYTYGLEAYLAWYSGDEYLMHQVLHHRPLGSEAWVFWLTVACNVVAPQLLWLRRVRRSAWWLFGVACLAQVGMWFERYLIVVVSLQAGHLPSSWASYVPTVVDLALFAGSIACFLFLFLLFLRLVPFVPIAETRHMLRELGPERVAPREGGR